MQTSFSLAQLKNPATTEAEKILRACVHCGFCNATCPTFVLLGDDLDSPRGRIYLIKDMLEKNRPADALTVKHIDRCLSCLACMTARPSGVNYMHLVDGARSHIEKTFRSRSRIVCSGRFLAPFSLTQIVSVLRSLSQPWPGLSTLYIRVLAGPGCAWPRCCALRQKTLHLPRRCRVATPCPRAERLLPGWRFSAAVCSRRYDRTLIARRFTC
jgi:ferredoxin